MSPVVLFGHNSTAPLSRLWQNNLPENPIAKFELLDSCFCVWNGCTFGRGVRSLPLGSRNFSNKLWSCDLCKFNILWSASSQQVKYKRSYKLLESQIGSLCSMWQRRRYSSCFCLVDELAYLNGWGLSRRLTSRVLSSSSDCLGIHLVAVKPLTITAVKNFRLQFHLQSECYDYRIKPSIYLQYAFLLHVAQATR